MLTAQDLHGVMGMMPAFATANAADIDATSTIDVDNLAQGVNRIIDDGIDVITTTGSFGEFHTLLDDEFRTLVQTAIDVVNRRVPLMIGCTSLNSRDAVRKMHIARDAGAEGVLVGVPFYFPSSVDNAVNFYRQIGERFPTLAIMIYHNPALHHVTLPVDALKELAAIPNVAAMKDSHRTTTEFMKLMRVIKGKISVFVHQTQYHPYASLGAAGLWSIEAWMGPWPVLALRDAVASGNLALAEDITNDIAPSGESPSLSWRETAAKIAQGYAGYCNPGPLRPPFVKIPEAVDERARRRAAYWQTICEKTKPHAKQRVLA
jgi:hydratase-aldolase